MSAEPFRTFKTEYCEVELTKEVIYIRDIQDDRMLVCYPRYEWSDNPYIYRDIALAFTNINELRSIYPPRDENGDPMPTELVPDYEDTEAYATLNVLKGQRNIDGVDRYTIEFLGEMERDVAYHRLRLYEKRLHTLSAIGHDLIQNGKSLSVYGAGQGRLRVEVGDIILSWAQCMAIREQSFAMKLEIKHLLKSVGADEELIDELEAKWRTADGDLD